MSESGRRDESGNSNGKAGPHPDTEDDWNQENLYAPKLPLLSRVKSIIEDEEGSGLSNRNLFTQLDVLSHFNDGQAGWKEMARWMKYQETVDTSGRWSKPHVPTGSMHSINEMRRIIADGTCALGFRLSSGDDNPNYIAEAVAETLRNNEKSGVTDRDCQLLIETILKPHKHKHRKASDKKDSSQDQSTGGYQVTSVSSYQEEENRNVEDKAKKRLLRRRSGEGKDISVAYHNYPPGARPDNLKPYKPNKRLTKKLPKGSEAANILVGQVSYLTKTVVAFCRFDPPRQMGDLTEVDLPTRFICVILGPLNTSMIWELTELGRAMGSLLNDKVFCEVAYKARNRQDLLDGIDEFIDELTVLPPSIWDNTTRLEPPSKTRAMDKIALRLEEAERAKGKPSEPPQEEGASEDPSLIRTGRLCGGLIYDIKHKSKYYLSDFKDGLHIQCLASIGFLFFACISPVVTFGGMMGQATDGYVGTIEMLLASAICGIGYALFAGQPLTIIASTGPLLVFEFILYRICQENDIDFLSLRLWVGVWVTVILLVMVVFDLSAMVRYITRFTEESFSILNSIIFIHEAFDKLYDISQYKRVHYGEIRETSPMSCFCTPSEWLPVLNETLYNAGLEERLPSNWTYKYREECITIERRLVVETGCISEEDCESSGGNLTGSACGMHHITQAVPNVFFLSVILFLGTNALALAIRNFRASPYFPSRIRSTLADFAVFLSIVIWTGVDYGFGLSTPKLNVPTNFETTRDDRTWFINPLAITHIWLIPAAFLPAILATIVIVLDQQISTVIVNRKEHKLVKGHGYHLDLFVLAILTLICSFLGLPWFVAATVRSLTHVKSLFKISEVAIPGEKPQMLGVREQRVTLLVIHLLIGLSTLITGVLRLIPMPVLYGVFLYMGITSLEDVQFVDRIYIMFMPTKNQPDYVYLRHVRTSRVHIFTAIQIICFIGMWVVKSIKATALGFPVMLIVLMIVRKLLDFCFTQTELYWLDHLLPEEYRRQEENRKIALGEDDDGECNAKQHDSANKKAAEAYGAP